MTRPRLLYVVSLFPCWSETFIVREIATMIAAGADVRILSLKAPSEKLVQTDAEQLLPRVRHPLDTLRAAQARVKGFLAHPLALSSTLLCLVRRLANQPVALAKSVEAVARGVEQIDWIRDFDPDVIHAHWGTYPSTVAWALSRILGKPFGFTCHAHDIFVNDHLLDEKIRLARAPVTISRFNVEWLATRITPLARERMTVVHCGVELSLVPFQAEGRQPGTILAVGRLDPIKGFEVLIDAVALMAQQGRPVRCRIIGSGPLEASLRAKIAGQRLGDRIELSGAVPQREVHQALSSASVFAMPSVVTPSGDRDGIPVALMEAMSLGTPVVSTRISGIPELIEDGQEGLLVPERDPPALADAISRLLDEPDLGRRLAARARLKIEREFDATAETLKLLHCLTHGQA